MSVTYLLNITGNVYNSYFNVYKAIILLIRQKGSIFRNFDIKSMLKYICIH